MALSLKNEADVLRVVPQIVRERRMVLMLRQADLARHSGVPLATLRLFERTGKISLESLAKILVSINAVDAFLTSFESAARPMRARAGSMEEFTRAQQAATRSRVRPPKPAISPTPQ